MNLRGPIRSNLLIFAAMAVVVPSALSQTVPSYDPATETKLKGTVEELKLDPPTGGKPVAYLIVKSGEDKVKVFLAPKSFLDEMSITFSPGEQVELTGCKVKENGADVILAREVVKSGDTVTFRFSDGKPAW